MLMVVVLAVLLVADVAARTVAERDMAARVKSATHASGTTGRISAFPFVWDVAVGGRVDEVRVVADNVPVGPIHLFQVAVDARGIRLDRHDLLVDHTVVITSISSAKLTLEIRANDLGTSIGPLGHVGISFPGGDTIAINLGTQVLTATVGVANGHDLVITAAGRQLLSLDLASSPLIPPCQMALAPVSGGFDLSCQVSPVPSSLLQLLARSRSS